jgi:hypothetical protein
MLFFKKVAGPLAISDMANTLVDGAEFKKCRLSTHTSKNPPSAERRAPADMKS